MVSNRYTTLHKCQFQLKLETHLRRNNVEKRGSPRLENSTLLKSEVRVVSWLIQISIHKICYFKNPGPTAHRPLTLRPGAPDSTTQRSPSPQPATFSVQHSRRATGVEPLSLAFSLSISNVSLCFSNGGPLRSRGLTGLITRGIMAVLVWDDWGFFVQFQMIPWPVVSGFRVQILRYRV